MDADAAPLLLRRLLLVVASPIVVVVVGEKGPTMSCGLVMVSFGVWAQ